MKKSHKILYWVFNGLLSAMMLLSATMYFVKTADVATVFTSIGYPVYLIYPSAIAKILGVIAILTRKSDMLKEWAYAGFFFDFLLAASGHLNAGDGEAGGAFIALALLTGAYITNGLAYGNLLIKKKGTTEA